MMELIIWMNYQEFVEGKNDLAKFKTDADSFVCAMMPGSSSVQIKTTPGTALIFSLFFFEKEIIVAMIHRKK